MDYLNTINEKFPIRRSDSQKDDFRKYIREEAQKLGRNAEVENNAKSMNIIIGDIESAKAVFTAHYDTPATSLVPNLMLPRNPILCYLYHLTYPITLAMLALAASKGIQVLLSLEDKAWMILYIILYLGVYFICTLAFTNKHNKNDNTSGVAAVMSIMDKCRKDDIAFILFDNEEKGLLGSKAYNKAHKDTMADKLVVNLDCIGVGDNILTIANQNAEKLGAYQVLKNILRDSDDYKVIHCPKRGSMANSDHKNFKCGIGIVSCKKSKLAGYYTSKIHTNKDTEAYCENVEFISDKLSEFANRL